MMSFIGIISNRKSFENIKNELIKLEDNISIIHINLKSITNVKNIKFEIIIIDEKIKKFDNNEESLRKICKESKYIIINSDINKEYEILKNDSNIIITYGLNRKAMITVSSISDTDILIYKQKTFENKYKKEEEIEERRIKIKEKNKLKVYEILVIYTIFSIYNKAIIEEI